MKRRHDSEDVEDEPDVSIPRMEEACEETHILQDLQTNLQKEGDLNTSIDKRLYETQKQYFRVYMERLMHKVPMGEDIVKIVKAGSNDFQYIFTAAKSVIQSQNRVKQIRAFHSIFDMVYNLMWRYVHEKVVSPTLDRVLSPKQLNLAYQNYHACSKMEEDGSVVEMQCLLYCIQEMLDSQEPMKIPNPLYSRFTQQMKAMSEYVITILVTLSKPIGQVEEPEPAAKRETDGGPISERDDNGEEMKNGVEPDVELGTEPEIVTELI